MGGGASKETDCECVDMTRITHWDDTKETWFKSLVEDHKINSTGQALQMCWSLIESSWSIRSETYRFVHDTKLSHALTSCKTVLNLAIETEKNEDQQNMRFWFIMNCVTSGIATVLLIFASYFIKNYVSQEPSGVHAEISSTSAQGRTQYHGGNQW